MFFAPPLLSAQKTIELKLIDGKFVPPATTPKIPQEFKDRGARFTVRAGDQIKFCASDKFVYKPFSYSKENRFEGLSGREGLKPGNCITVKAKNSGDKCIQFRLSDEIRDKMQLIIVVLPANWPNEGEENTPPAANQAPGELVGNVDLSKLVGDWDKNSQLGIQHFRFPVEFLWHEKNEIIGSYGRYSTTNHGRITGGSYNATTSILSFTYVQNLDKKPGTATLLWTETETEYYLTGTWKHDDGTDSGGLMMKRRYK